MANKVTKREVINAMLADENIKANQMFVDYLEHEIELLDKKSANRKPTKAQKENKELAEVVLSALNDEGATVSEIQAKNESLANLSNQKVASLLRGLVNDGKAEKVVKGRKSLFKAVAA